jgi:electron transfer flavoprotein alpha subunit
VVVVVEPGRTTLARELLSAAAWLAGRTSRRVVAVALGRGDPRLLGSWGADELVVVDGAETAWDAANAVRGWARDRSPWAILTGSTTWGREVAARVAAALGAGLTGDAVGLDLDGDRLVCWKPAFGGGVVAAITATSPVQMATVRSGVLAVSEPRDATASSSSLSVEPNRRVRTVASGRDDDLDVLAHARVVVGVGMGVSPEEYPTLDPLLRVLRAELGATRKVTDRGWLPRSRQIGITGRSIAPRLYVSLGASGRFNHMIGTRAAGTLLAVDRNPDAEIFDAADVGIVGDWHDVLPLLVAELEAVAAPGRSPS